MKSLLLYAAYRVIPYPIIVQAMRALYLLVQQDVYRALITNTWCGLDSREGFFVELFLSRTLFLVNDWRLKLSTALRYSTGNRLVLG